MEIKRVSYEPRFFIDLKPGELFGYGLRKSLAMKLKEVDVGNGNIVNAVDLHENQTRYLSPNTPINRLDGYLVVGKKLKEEEEESNED